MRVAWILGKILQMEGLLNLCCQYVALRVEMHTLHSRELFSSINIKRVGEDRLAVVHFMTREMENWYINMPTVLSRDNAEWGVRIN